MNRTKFGFLALVLLLSIAWLVSAKPSFARDSSTYRYHDIAQTFPNDEYNATVQSFQCRTTAPSSNWSQYTLPNTNIEPKIVYPSGIINGHNVRQSDTLGLFIGSPRITPKVWILGTSLNGDGQDPYVGYRITITKIQTKKAAAFTDMFFRFLTTDQDLDHIGVIARPQDSRKPSKFLTVGQMEVLPDPSAPGWRIARATRSQFGFDNNTFVRVFDIYQVGQSGKPTEVAFGRFDVRHTNAQNLDRLTLNLDPLGCVLGD
ncbi:MAG: hypothetical protein JST89_00905 [Cyanobacteria bacterium SZAS-4]|nr:hypothetical protein [Cyanobacteria bacterium SZAS-4]